MISRGEMAITVKPERRPQRNHLSSLTVAGQAEAQVERKRLA
jgi:hypothetical protein